MSLSDEQVELIQASFARLAPVSDDAGLYFYARLFEIAPELRPMFPGDVTDQGRKLMAMLTAVVRGLGELSALMPVARQLAVRHVRYGVRPEHYAPVGEALIETLDAALGDEFTAETRTAWADAYGALSGAMIDAAYPRAEAA